MPLVDRTRSPCLVGELLRFPGVCQDRVKLEGATSVEAGRKPHEAAPALSVIVATRNRPRQLQALLDSLARQAGADAFSWELIVIDDASREPERRRIEQVLARWRGAPLIHERLERRGWPGRARNAGAAGSRGAVLLFSDDDLVLDSRVLAETHRLHALHPEIEVLNGRLCKLRDDYYSNFWHYYYDAVFNARQPVNGPYAIHRIGGLVSFKRHLLERLGPLYDESLPAREDFDLALRLRAAGVTAYKDDRIVAYHDFRQTWWAFVAQRVWYEKGEWALERKHGAARLQSVYRSEPRIPRRYRFLPLYLSSHAARRLWRLGRGLTSRFES